MGRKWWWRAEDSRLFLSRDMHHGMTLLPLTLNLCEIEVEEEIALLMFFVLDII